MAEARCHRPLTTPCGRQPARRSALGTSMPRASWQSTTSATESAAASAAAHPAPPRSPTASSASVTASACAASSPSQSPNQSLLQPQPSLPQPPQHPSESALLNYHPVRQPRLPPASVTADPTLDLEPPLLVSSPHWAWHHPCQSPSPHWTWHRPCQSSSTSSSDWHRRPVTSAALEAGLLPPLLLPSARRIRVSSPVTSPQVTQSTSVPL